MIQYDRWYAEEQFFEYRCVRIEGPKVCTAHTAYHALLSGADLSGNQFRCTVLWTKLPRRTFTYREVARCTEDM